jgi:hypothetical protein
MRAPAPRERDRVVGDVALDVEDVEPRDVAHGLAHGGLLELAERGRAAGERLGVVVGVLAVHRGQRVQ